MKRTSKSLLALLIAAMLCMVCFVGCTDKGTAGSGDVQNATVEPETDKTGETVTITFWIDNTIDAREATYQKLIDQFEDENPNIKVELLGVAGDMTQKLDTALAAGSPPDCSTLIQGSVSSLILNNKLVPLDSYLANWDYYDQVLPSAWETVLSFNPIDEQKYTLPFASNVWCLWVNNSLYEAKNLDLPTNWEKFFKGVEEIYDPDSKTYGVAIRGGAGGGTSLEYMMYSYSGLTEYFDENGKCTVNDPKNVEFVEKYLGLYGKYTAESDLNNGWSELAAAFQSGSAATIMHNLGSSNAHAEVFENDYTKFQAMPLPACDAGYTVYPQMNVSGYCIYSDSKHQDAAWRFISWLSEADQASAVAQTYGIMPVNSVALKADWVNEYPWFQMASKLMSDSNTKYYNAPFTYPEYASIISTYIEPMIQQCMAGEITAQELCDTWAGLMEDMKTEFDSVFAK